MQRIPLLGRTNKKGLKMTATKELLKVLRANSNVFTAHLQHLITV